MLTAVHPGRRRRREKSFRSSQIKETNVCIPILRRFNHRANWP